ncbi:MAG: tRNA (adenosine(37)-N6)-threonylcarbamoyltransferase complex transferase subunit TsaD [Lentisphaerae bacterium]|nr:tRNA (adenosine(37)-N6)-threonylcarbamoyltransferase complex transferase subunit TsaD [Lentisphaerota bacterium]
MNVLGIETSCDETAAAVVRDGCRVLSNVVLSQTDLHAPYGGVVPEIASRRHAEALPGIIDEARRRAGLAWHEIDEVAATAGPGLAAALLVGLSAGKGLALALERPFCGVNHLEAHLYSLFLGASAPAPGEICPCVALLVSGGHTCLVRVERPGSYRMLGRTVDDAAGEAFDKGANLLGLGYPGGPAIDRAARGGARDAVRFPRGRQRKGAGCPDGLDPALCFSFSGVKTALLYYLREHPAGGAGPAVADIAASYQEAIVEALVRGCRGALEGARCLAAAGGVALNGRLRERLAALAAAAGVRLVLADPAYCTDNAAMVAAAAGAGRGIRGAAGLRLDAWPNMPLA